MNEYNDSNDNESNAKNNDKNNDSNNDNKRLEVRVAGGWVRDKILQQHTHDVDVAVNAGLTGVQMAELVRQHCWSAAARAAAAVAVADTCSRKV